MKNREHRPDHAIAPRTTARRDHAVAPGKRTLAMCLTPRHPAGAAPLQRRPVPATAQAIPSRPQATGGPVADWMAVALRPDRHQTPIMRERMDEIGYAGPDVLSAPANSAGTAIPAAVQAKMEQALGADFSSVRIHEGPEAQAMGALAYTQGTNIHFAPGQYEPGGQSGQELLGHELAHVVQQSQGRVRSTAQAKGVDINTDASLESEADEWGARAARGERAGWGGALHEPAVMTSSASASGTVQRKLQSEEGCDGFYWDTRDIETSSPRCFLHLGGMTFMEQYSDEIITYLPGTDQFQTRTGLFLDPVTHRYLAYELSLDAYVDQDGTSYTYDGTHYCRVWPLEQGGQAIEQDCRNEGGIPTSPSEKPSGEELPPPQQQPESVLARILGGMTTLDVQERVRKRFERMPCDEEERHKQYMMVHRDQMLGMYRLQNLTPTRLDAFRDMPLPVLDLVCSAGLLPSLFALPADKVSCIASFSLDHLQFLLDIQLLIPVCERVQAEILNLLHALPLEAFLALGEHLLISLEGLTGLRKSRLSKLLTLPLDRFLAVMSLPGDEIVELYQVVPDEIRLGRMTDMKPSVFHNFLALSASCRLGFLRLDNQIVKQFFANPVPRQEALMTDAEIGAMDRIAEQDLPYCPRLGTKPKQNTGIHEPHSLAEHGAHIGDAEMGTLAQSSPVDRKSRWASAEVQEQCMEWARASYGELQYIAQEGCYAGNGIDISRVGSYPAAGEVFHKGSQSPVPTRKFNVVIYLDQSNQPHVYTAYPVP
jgi:hypothetical protein